MGDNPQKSASAVSIELASGPIESGKNVTAVGFGITEFHPKYLSKTLRKISVQTLAISECQKYFEHKLWDSQICTISPKGKGVCNGDSGGPLINDEGKVVGVVSYLVPCAQGYPDVYTSIAYFRDWILNTVAQN